MITDIITKTRWGPGPWEDEPDEAQWIDEATGLECFAARNPHVGVWAGYVGVPRQHPLYGVRRDVCPVGCAAAPDCGHTPEGSILVHGGVTYAGRSPRRRGARGDQSVADQWWFGFDCGHAWDGCPAIAGGEYRTLAYVRDQCADLARQLRAGEAGEAGDHPA